MKIRHMMICAGVALLAASGIQAATGESWKSTASLSSGSAKTVTLVKEKNLDWVSGDDPEDKYFDSGVYYFKISASRGKAYTVTVSPNSAEADIDASIDDVSMYDWNKEVNAPWWDSDIDPDGQTLRFILAADEWDFGDGTKDDPGHDKTVTYYLCISGDVGTSVKVSMTGGEEGYTPPSGGSEATAVSISVGEKQGSYSGKLINGEFYLKAALKKGVAYKFGTTGGKEDAMLDVTVYSANNTEIEVAPYEDWADDNNGGVLAVPSKDATYIVMVTGESTYGSFGLRYGTVSMRKASAHTIKASLGTITTAGKSAACAPGLRSEPNSGFFDTVIDTDLFKMTLTAGNTYVFETSGATTNLVMELYKSSGMKAILSNTRGFPTGFDCKMAYTCTSDGTYYVGVCQDLEDGAKKSDLAKTPCTFTARLVTTGIVDAWDPDDDTLDSATPLQPAVGTGSPITKGAAHGPHTFGATDWVDTYTLPVRAGLTYKIGSRLKNASDASGSAWRLGASIYKDVNKKMLVRDIADLNNISTTLSPTENATYYIEVKPTGGQGVDYGEHFIKTLVGSKSESLGFLNVDIGGATASEGAGWSIKADGKNAPIYPSGTIALPVGSYKIVFQDVKGWTAPAAKTVTVVSNATTTLVRRYSDESDAADISKDATDGDGSTKGAKLTTLKPSAKVQKVVRSLWKDDAADWFKFKSKVGASYTFSLTGGAEKLADATLTVYRKSSSSANVIATTAGTGETSVSFLCKEDAVNYYVAVKHAQSASAQDAQYTLKYSMKQVGIISFKAEAYSAKDTDASVSLNVTRTDGTDGVVRVRWTTHAGTGTKPGEDYVPASGILKWSDGNSGTKTIKIALLPDLKSHWSGSRTFTVELAVLASSDLEPGELAPVCGTRIAKVTIKDAATKEPGTLEFVEKTASTKAGQPLEIVVRRTGGSDGTVGCTITQADSTAKAGVNYVAWSGNTARLVWNPGEEGEKTVSLQTLAVSSKYPTSKKLKLTMAIDKKQSSTATLGPNAKMTVTVTDPNATKDFASYQTFCGEQTGIAVASTGNWYFSTGDSLVNETPSKGGTATLTFTLTGPGKFAFTPKFDNGGSAKNTIACKIDKKTQKVTSGTRVVRYLASGSHTVAITVTRDKSTPGSGAVATFAPEADGMPFLWKPLSAATYLAPLKGEVINGGELRWMDDGDDDIEYRVAIATSQKTLAKTAGGTPLNYSGGRNEHCLDCMYPPVEPGKTYYWRVDSVMDKGELVNTNGTVMSFTVLGPGAPTMKFKPGAQDALGKTIVAAEAEGMPWPVTLVQGVKTTIGLDVESANTNGTEGASFTYAKVSGTLPSGMSVSSNGRITGTPTKAGEFAAVIQIVKSVTTGKGKKATTMTTPGGTLALAFTVKPLNLAAGKFNGLVSTEDVRVTEDLNDGIAANTFGSLTVTTRTAPKVNSETQKISSHLIEANLSLGGQKYKFTGDSWDSYKEDESGLAFVTATLSAKNTLVRSKKSSLCVTNRLTLTACCSAEDAAGALDVPLKAELNLGLLGNASPWYRTNIRWTGTAVRDNTGLESELERIKPWAGYYTVALAPCGKDVPAGVQGNGYLTVTISEKGVAKVAGVLADRATKISASAKCAYLSAKASDSGAEEVLFPVFYSTATESFGGWLHLTQRTYSGEEYGDGLVLPVVRSTVNATIGSEPLRWIRAKSGTTIDGAGFLFEIEPAGGWYDTQMNLMRYYHDRNIAWTVPAVSDLVSFGSYLLTSTYSKFVAFPGCKGDAETLVLAGNATALTKDNVVSMAKQNLVYRTDNAKLIDWAKSTNPSNLKFSFVRATGLYSGSFEVWGGNAVMGSEKKQKRLATCKHSGVLLLTRGEDVNEIPELDNIAPGAYTLSLKVDGRSITASYPFVVRPEETAPVWDDPAWKEELPSANAK